MEAACGRRALPLSGEPFLFPALVAAGGIGLAVLATAIDDALGDATSVPFTLAMSSNAATWLLATVAGAMITTVGVVFSLTVVSLQLASSQFSPRVMRSFIGDRLSQTVIGLLVATFFYCVLILPNISGEATQPAPRISLMVAGVLTLVTVVAIIAHLDHLARRRHVGHVMRAIAKEGEAVAAAVGRIPEGVSPVRDAELTPPPGAVVIPEPGQRVGQPGRPKRAAEGCATGRDGTGRNPRRRVHPRRRAAAHRLAGTR